MELWTVLGTPWVAAVLSAWFAFWCSRGLRGQGVSRRDTALAVFGLYLGMAVLLSAFGGALWLTLRPLAAKVGPSRWDATVSWAGLPYIVGNPMILGILGLAFLLSSFVGGIGLAALMASMRLLSAERPSSPPSMPAGKHFAGVLVAMAIYAAVTIFACAAFDPAGLTPPYSNSRLPVSPEAHEAWKRRSLESDQRMVNPNVE